MGIQVTSCLECPSDHISIRTIQDHAPNIWIPRFLLKHQDLCGFCEHWGPQPKYMVIPVCPQTLGNQVLSPTLPPSSPHPCSATALVPGSPSTSTRGQDGPFPPIGGTLPPGGCGMPEPAAAVPTPARRKAASTACGPRAPSPSSPSHPNPRSSQGLEAENNTGRGRGGVDEPPSGCARLRIAVGRDRVSGGRARVCAKRRGGCGHPAQPAPRQGWRSRTLRCRISAPPLRPRPSPEAGPARPSGYS